MFTDEQVAQVAHEANRAYQIVTGENQPDPRWEDYSPDGRALALRGIKVAKSGVTPEQQHEHWLVSKASTGWVRGSVKDAVAKTHPCIVSYDDLSEQERIKDVLYGAVVRALCPGVRLGDPDPTDGDSLRPACSGVSPDGFLCTWPLMHESDVQQHVAGNGHVVLAAWVSQAT